MFNLKIIKMKKSIFLALAAVVVLGLSTLTSCKGNKSAATKEVKDSTTAKPAEEKPAATEEKK